MQYNVISADSHINEPPGTWIDRVPAKFKDVAPRVVPTSDGGEGFKFPEEAHVQSFGLASATLQKGIVRGPEQYIANGLKFEDIARGSWDPKQHVEDMKTDGCDASVLYAGVAANMYNIKDRELRLASFRAFNDWLGEFCSYDPARLIGPPMLPVEEESIQDAIDELHRNVKQWKIRTAQIPIFPWKRYFDKFYDPLWAVAQEMDLSLAFHRGLNRPFAFGSPSQGGPFMSNQVMRDFSYCMPFADLVFGGTFDRFPNLEAGLRRGPHRMADPFRATVGRKHPASRPVVEGEAQSPAQRLRQAQHLFHFHRGPGGYPDARSDRRRYPNVEFRLSAQRQHLAQFAQSDRGTIRRRTGRRQV